MSAVAQPKPVAQPNRPLRSMEQGLRMLEQFTAERPERGIRELAAELQVVPSAAHRYASTCLELGYLEQTATRRYRATQRCAEPGIALLGSLAGERLCAQVNRDQQDRDQQDGNQTDRTPGAREEQSAARAFPSLREARYARSLERGLAILACFTAERALLGASELAAMLGTSRASTHRYASTLVTLGYLERDPALRKYRLGSRVIELGMGARNATGLCRHARPHLRELAKRGGVAVALAVLDGPEILVIEQASSAGKEQSRPGESGGAGTRLPAYCTSSGKVLLAHLPAERLTELIAQMSFERRGPKTITSEQALREQLEKVRARGLAVSDEECRAGTVAIAAPVHDDSGDVVAAVNVARVGEEPDLEELVDLHAAALKVTAAQISAGLGWSDA